MPGTEMPIPRRRGPYRCRISVTAAATVAITSSPSGPRWSPRVVVSVPPPSSTTSTRHDSWVMAAASDERAGRMRQQHGRRTAAVPQGVAGASAISAAWPSRATSSVAAPVPTPRVRAAAARVMPGLVWTTRNSSVERVVTPEPPSFCS